MNPGVQIPKAHIAEFCRANRIVRLAIFGSALRDDFGADSDIDFLVRRTHADSDIDFLVRFEEGARVTLFDMNRMAAELENLFGRDVDLVSQRGVERSPNQFRREVILESAEPIYES